MAGALLEQNAPPLCPGLWEGEMEQRIPAGKLGRLKPSTFPERRQFLSELFLLAEEGIDEDVGRDIAGAHDRDL